MDVLRLVAAIVNTLLLVYVLLLLVRLILEYIPMFNRSWRPRGAGLIAAEIVYTVTDPPIKLIRRFIPPLRVGAVAIDFAFPLTMLICFVLLSITRTIAG
ncbi:MULTISPECIES: YggT family protein [unclassified Microbacterium]|uniref:YggT family protein n=1 Tax=unclassified Microbacterium TaxID=2609290 RepID=UPI00214C3402|nr:MULTISPECIES: YggT family protein [unclassified Microbacterium]MCR2785873.1 YggT family protein [Microbacterium sp. zg.B96]MDL5350010.1 YggT family protein [Microbacterium sp. zg-YB36]WIM17150.1 YggT family protein [Microbacterium sp. zg-B96]